jgi:hypothetical protein
MNSMLSEAKVHTHDTLINYTSHLKEEAPSF